MNTQLDPYLDWLQISPDRRPPTHYDLLGLPTFEADAQRAQAAAMRRIAYVRKYQMGMHSEAAIQLMGEISRALTCLSDPESKRAYDAQLRGLATLLEKPSVHETVLDETAQPASALVSTEPEASFVLEPLAPDLAGVGADAGLDRLTALVELAVPPSSEREPAPAKGKSADLLQAAAEVKSESNSRFLAIVAASVAAALVVLLCMIWMLSDKEPVVATAADSRTTNEASDPTGDKHEENSATDPESPAIAAGPKPISTLPPKVAPPEPMGRGNLATSPPGMSPPQPSPLPAAGTPAPPAAIPPVPGASPAASAPSWPAMPSAALSQHGYWGFVIAPLVRGIIDRDPELSVKAHGVPFNELQYALVQRLDGQVLQGYTYQIFKIRNTSPVRLRWAGYSADQRVALRSFDGREFVDVSPGGLPAGTHELTISRPAVEPFVYLMVQAPSGTVFTDHFEVLNALPAPTVMNSPLPPGATNPPLPGANNPPLAANNPPQPEFEKSLAEVKTLVNRTRNDKRADANKWREVSNKLALLEQQVRSEAEKTLTNDLRDDLAKLARNRVDAAIKQKGKNVGLYTRFLQEAMAMDPNGEAGQEAQQMLGSIRGIGRGPKF